MKNWPIRIKVDGVTQLRLSLAGEQEQYYVNFPEDELPDEVRDMLRVFEFASHDRTGHMFHYIPVIIEEFDHYPVTKEEVFEKILAGQIGMAHDSPGTLKEVARRFIARKATFTELQAAVGRPK